MMMKVLDVLLSAMLVGAFLYIALATFDIIRILIDAVVDFAARLIIDMKQKVRKRRYENPESLH